MGVDGTPLLLDGKGSDGNASRLTLPQLKRKVWRITLSLVAANAFAIALLLVVGRSYPPLVPTGVLALSFGLRHAVDADHIAAIDNVTRRLIADGRQPLLTGLWFSLGHSSVVGLICVLTACGSAYFQEHAGFAEGIGQVVSTSVSAGLLLAIGLANLLSLVGCCGIGDGEGSPSSSPRGEAHDEASAAERAQSQAAQPSPRRAGHHHYDLSSGGGLLVRCCRGVLRTIDAEWKMLLLGFLFGLGFETSSEVALLALAAMSPSQGIPPLATLILPLLFATGSAFSDGFGWLRMASDGSGWLRMAFWPLLVASGRSRLPRLLLGGAQCVRARACLSDLVPHSLARVRLPRLCAYLSQCR